MKKPPADFTKVTARVFDPKGELPEDLALIAGIVRGMATGAPLAVPIDPAAIASPEHPHAAWGLAEDMRLGLALALLKSFESGSPKLLETMAKLARRPKSDLSQPTIMGEAIAGALSEKGAMTTKSDLRKHISRKISVPDSKKAGDFWRKHGLQDFPRGRLPEDEY